MTALEGLRYAIRRKAIAEDWPADLLAVAESLADTARDDGTHALRTVDQMAEDLGLSTSTIKRRRSDLLEAGVLEVRRKGGNGSGGTVFDLASSGSRFPVSVTPDPAMSRGSDSPVIVSPDSRSSGSVGAQSGLTVEREREPGLQASSPASKQQPETREQTMDDADWLAAELGADPAACRQAIDLKRRQAADRGQPWRSATTMVRSTIPLDEWRPLVQHRRPARPRRSVATCDGGCPGTEHEWTTNRGRSLHLCPGW